MSRIVMLEADRHRGLRLGPVPQGGAGALVPLGRGEVPLAMSDAPVVLAKDSGTGAFEIAALVGLVEPRNLFWQGGRWLATYLPERILSAPFRLTPDSPTGLSIDRTDARLGDRGEPLFEADGAPAAALLRERARLERLVSDIDDARRSAAALVAARVVRPLAIGLTFADGSQHEIDGLYGMDAEALADLPDARVLDLYRAGDLALAALIAASLSQIERLKQLHNGTTTRYIRAVDAEMR